MATPAQIEANRLNAKKSTGPKSAEGKLNTASNSTKFGLFSAINVVHADEREEYDALSDGLFAELKPSGALEDMIVTDIVRSAWRLRRCVAAEADLAA